jgi:putative addiction module component (TIGR02574 family)
MGPTPTPEAVMSARMKSLGLDRLSADERTVLAYELLDSVEEDARASRLTEEQRKELERRIAEADTDPDGGIPWEEVRDEVRAMLKAMRK